MTLGEQIKRHSLAIISLLVALTTLSYNTWRNEQTEENRNIRHAGFEMLVHIGELQRIAYLAHYDKDEQGGSPRKGWAEILVIQDLAKLMPEAEPVRSDALHDAWNRNWSGLGADDHAIAAIDDAIDDLRQDIAAVLESLD